MALAPINPTNLTPPRVEFIDPRSGAISREWYRFFLSLLNATESNQSEVELAPDTASLLATYDSMLETLTQTTETQPDCCASGQAVLASDIQALALTPPSNGGTVTSVSGTGTVSGITLTGTVTTSGSLTLGGTLSGVSLTTQVSGTLPVANGGTGVTTSTGTGSVVLSAGPTFTGTLNAATISATKILPNVQSIASASTITPNADTDTQVSVTALAVPATIASPSGTPSDGQSLVIRIEDNGTGRALTWTTGSSGAYRAVGITLPTTTVATKVLYVGCKYNSTDLRWDAIALSQEA